MKLEPVLAAHEQKVEAIVKDIAKLNTAVKAWRKACAMGSLAARTKSASQAMELSKRIQSQIGETSGEWEFDIRAYLVDDWMEELAEAALAAEIRTFRVEEMCIMPPLAISARPAQESLYLGKEKLKMLRPKAVVAEIQKRLSKNRDSANAEFLESVYQTWDKRQDKSVSLIKFRDVYDTFCLAPGWKKDNAPPVFAQQIYALHVGGLSTTKSGKVFNLQEPSSKVKESDVFEVRAKDGRPIRYYGISFAG